ncbi:beta strand repeat-containing protein [Fodinibius salsisoli]|uniref:IPT/TIG domain-containing protein n=1 Tax=Fodinibius salsisoli TaxID=2820877 RepID=A0ABT3PTI3_9BACT|nr:IPT/TIG domain-containing protein [Fodinibius salsisoli]MCW9709179.1 IPT/TIG domain-containing protein [Fodinibius salsisoli]
MKKPAPYLSWFVFLFVCLITVALSCSDNSGGSQQSTIEITSLSPDSGAVGSLVRISSDYIDPEHANNQVELNGLKVPILSYGAGSLQFRVPEGATSGPVTLSVNGKVANGPYFKVLTEGPAITAISPASGGPGTQVTITGEHFLPPSAMAKMKGDSTGRPLAGAPVDSLGADTTQAPLKAKGTPSPSINGLPVSVTFGDQLAPLLSLSATEIIAKVPEGATGGTITVTVGDQTVVSSVFRLMLGPVISQVSPTAGPAGTQVTITGHYFSPDPDSNRVTFNGIPAALTHTDSTRLMATVPNEATTGPVEVITRGQTTEGPTFSVTEAPVPQVAIDDISPKQGPVGTAVTISGQNFSAVNTENTVTFNGTEATINNATETTLEVSVPQGATNGPVKVAVGSQTAEGPSFTVTSDPEKQLTVTGISPKEGPEGTAVTITGANFSATASDNAVTFNGTEATVTSASTTELVVTVPQGATTGNITVGAGDQTATGPTFSVTDAPVPQVAIEDISPKQGPVGTAVTITGHNFSGTASENTVTFNGTKATISNATETTLEVSVPQGATSGPVKVSASGQTATGPSFTVTEAPVPQVTIDDLNPKSGPVGTSVTITGANFSATASDNAVRFNGTEATVNSASTTELVVTVPQGATTGTVTVGVGDQTATGPTFTVTETPVPEVTIDDLSPKEGPVGTAVTISGQNFSATKAENIVTFNGTEASISSATETTLEVSVPQGATTGPVSVETNGQTAEGPTFSVTADPDQQLAISNISPKEGPVGTTVTITGANFSATASENAVTFNGSQAMVSSASTTELVATVPQDATSGPVTVKVGSQTTTGPTFTVGDNAAPTITGEGSSEIQENIAVVATITASDPDGDALAFGLSSGADQGLFNINNDSGVLSFTTAPDFENPADENGDNSYELEVKVTDGSVIVTKTITVTVTNVDEAPVLTSPTTLQADENSTDAGSIAASDPEGQPLAYDITGGADANAITIDPTSGALTLDAAPDFESPADANSDNGYEMEVTISDGNLSTTQAVTITVQDVNEAPVITSAGPFEIQENNAAVGTITASDPDGDALDFALLGGTKGTLTFSIDASTGEITISPAPDFERPRDDNSDNTYEMDINVNDGALGTSQTVSITITNVVELPIINRGTIRPARTESYFLNTTNEANVYRFDPVPAGTDLNNILNFSLGTSLSADLATSATVTGGADGGLFSVNSINSYAIHIDGPSSLDYSHSADGNAHEYRFTVTAENAAGVTPTYTIIIPVQNPFAGGSGTAADPYQVETIDQLQTVGQFLDAHFVQTADIDASATSSWNGGQGFDPIGVYTNPFTGSYDGDGHTIDGLTIDRSQGDVFGLFGVVSSGGQIINVGLTNTDITTNNGTGGLVGYNRGGGTIADSYISGTITSSTNTTGGLVGENSGVIRRSYSVANVNGRANVGGLVGTNRSGNIINCYAMGDVHASLTIAGGLVGNNKGDIDHSYATGVVTSANTIGGLVGYEDTTVGTTLESYWDTQSSGQATSDGGTGLTTSQMQGTAAETNMTGFDFGGIWTVSPNEYPILIGVGGQ